MNNFQRRKTIARPTLSPHDALLTVQPKPAASGTHDLVSGTHKVSGLTANQYLAATGAANFAFQEIQFSHLGGTITDTQHGVRTLANAHAHADLSGVTSDQHHAQSHTHASHTSIGANDHHAQSHTHASHTSIGTDDHHAQAHGPAQHTTGTAWRALYLNSLGDETEFAFGAAGTYYRSAGVSSAPTFSAILDADVPSSHSGSAHHAQAHGPAQHTTGTAWRIHYQNASGDDTELALGAAGTVLTSNGASSAPSFAMAGPTTVEKTADETVNNDTALQNDDALLLAIAANERWYCEFNLKMNSGSTADFKAAITVPTGASLAYAWRSPYNTPVSAHGMDNMVTASGTATEMGGQGAAVWVQLVCWVNNGANAGNIQLQWAQNSLTVADTTVEQGSTLVAHKLA